jgi:hypothetical protein
MKPAMFTAPYNLDIDKADKVIQMELVEWFISEKKKSNVGVASFFISLLAHQCSKII